MREQKTRNRVKLIAEANKNSLTALLKQDLPLEEKYRLVEERNPFIHAFGRKLKVVIKGEEDDKGNIVLELPEEVDGYSAIIKQRRVSRKIDEDKAEEVITARGMEETLYKTIRVVDEDALMAALYNDELTEAEIDEMYPQSITWALVLKK